MYKRLISTDPQTGMLKARLIGNSYRYIKHRDKDGATDQTVYAINWFNSQWIWIYHIYNWLALTSVKKVGGQAFFKGCVDKTLLGHENDHRDVLLIVRYPSVTQFLKMLQSKYFLLVSILRLLAVSDFTFGFTRRCDINLTTGHNTSIPGVARPVFAVHHYRSHKDLSTQLSNVAETQDVHIDYVGRINSLLYTGEELKSTRQVDCVMDGVILLSAATTQQITNMIHQQDYQAVIAQTDSSYIATLKRMTV